MLRVVPPHGEEETKAATQSVVTTVRLNREQRDAIERLVGPFDSGRPYRSQSEALQHAVDLMLDANRKYLGERGT